MLNGCVGLCLTWAICNKLSTPAFSFAVLLSDRAVGALDHPTAVKEESRQTQFLHYESNIAFFYIWTV